MTTHSLVRRPVVEVLYVEECPNYQGTLSLVQRVRDELGIDAEIRSTLVGDQAAAEQARFPGSRRSGWTAATWSPAASRPPSTLSPAACIVWSTGSPASPRSAGSARRCCVQPAEPERDLSLATGEKTATVSC